MHLFYNEIMVFLKVKRCRNCTFFDVEIDSEKRKENAKGAPPSAPRRASAPGRQATLRRAAADAPARLRRTRKRFRAIR
ncbi:TPA: hypothetical protein ACJJXT_004364 [Enterobacter hormaechei subsp. hoffmannii]|uniref:Uncharacterized protein n=1 Tax=Citrobacter tructae TaxID=2562449 RepID=A0ABX5T0L2_9ENTR|nr:hypothetical protein EVV94_26195 [Enterobacter cloacae]QBX78903.1 hypothetical protein E4Z61_00475 [Citrobacter tructae]